VTGRTKTGTMLVLAVLASAWTAPPAARDDGDEPRPTLTVQGQAEVAVAPDTATVRLGATIQAPEAAAAQRQVKVLEGEVLKKLALETDPGDGG